jgi:hypothetical protein
MVRWLCGLLAGAGLAVLAASLVELDLTQGPLSLTVRGASVPLDAVAVAGIGVLAEVLLVVSLVLGRRARPRHRQ